MAKTVGDIANANVGVYDAGFRLETTCKPSRQGIVDISVVNKMNKYINIMMMMKCWNGTLVPHDDSNKSSAIQLLNLLSFSFSTIALKALK